MVPSSLLSVLSSCSVSFFPKEDDRCMLSRHETPLTSDLRPLVAQHGTDKSNPSGCCCWLPSLAPIFYSIFYMCSIVNFGITDIGATRSSCSIRQRLAFSQTGCCFHFIPSNTKVARIIIILCMREYLFIIVHSKTGNADRLGAMRAKNTGAMNIHSCPLAAVYTYLAWPITKVTFLTAVFELTTSMRPSYIDTVYRLRYTVNSNWKPASSLQSRYRAGRIYVCQRQKSRPRWTVLLPNHPSFSVFGSVWPFFRRFDLILIASSLADVCRDA